MRIAISLFFVFAIFYAIPSFADEVIKRNISWSFEGNNDPIIQVTNQGDQTRTLHVRLLFGSDSYRYPVDLEVPSGENRFLHVREVFKELASHYPDLDNQSFGILQLEFEGTDREIQTQLLNLNPRSGITSEKGSEKSPVIRTIQPQSGDVGGGTSVNITGENFSDSTTVRIGGIAAPHTRQSNSILIAIAPAHAEGAVDVQVSNGKRSALLRHGFRYETGGPVIAAIDPDNGSIHGGYKLTVKGRNFKQGAVIQWNGNGLNTQYLDAQTLSITVPPGTSGPVGIEVINPDKRNFVMNDGFRYKALPHISSIVPDTGVPAGGFTVTIYGSNFESDYSVLFGNRYGQTTFVNQNALAAVVPPAETGSVDVSVTSKEGDKDTLQDGFLYNEPPRILSITAEPNPIVRNTTSTLRVKAQDPDADPLNYEYRIAQGPAGGSITGQGDEAIYHSPNTIGHVIIQVTVYDQHGAKAQQTFEVDVE